MADHVMNSNAQRTRHPLPIASPKNSDLDTISLPPAHPIESKFEQPGQDGRGQSRPHRRNTSKRGRDVYSKTRPLASIADKSQAETHPSSVVIPLTSQIPTRRLCREPGLEPVRLQKVLYLKSDATSTQPRMNPARLFVASLGNPPPYSSTRHSAGHILLKALQSYLSLPNFTKSKAHGNGLTSIGAEIGRSEYTLWQSPSQMNISGAALLKAYKTHVAATQDSPADPMPGLVILYDEMETSPAQLKLRRGATSAKGHNGVKSVQQSLQSAGLMDKLGDRFVKIGIGIGRPASGSRSSEDVSQYVLGQLTASEKHGIDGKVPELVKLLEQEMVRMSK